ncbi:hypothetical protein J6590_008119 [Homalodisca vitripennis]|nr:hypothetical protein J6590_008119 [Homalodisca vitripennis]
MAMSEKQRDRKAMIFYSSVSDSLDRKDECKLPERRTHGDETSSRELLSWVIIQLVK